MNIKNVNNRKLNIFLSFLLPIGIVLAICIVHGIFIRGEKSFFFSDLNNIYADLLLGLKHNILAGENIIYNWKMGGGINFIPYIVGNLSSILNLAVLLTPDSFFQETVLVLQLIRIGLAGWGMYSYLSFHYKKDCIEMVGFAVGYAASAYSICFIQHIMWFDVIALLPVVIMYAEKLLERNDIIDIKFILLLVFTFWSSFYMGYMVSIFVFLYSINVTCKQTTRIRKVLENILKIVMNGITAAGVSAVFLLPTGLAMLQSGELVDFGIQQKFKFSEIIYQMFIGNFDTYHPGGRPMLYCGIIVLLLLILYFGSPIATRKEKIVDFVSIIILLVSLEFAPFYYIWHMFDDPSWFEARFSFVVIFFCLTLAYRVINHMEQVKRKAIVQAGSLLLLTLYFTSQIFENLGVISLSINVFFVIAYIVVWLKSIDEKSSYRWIITLLFVCELGINAGIVSAKMFRNEPCENYKYYNEFRAQNRDLVTYVENQNAGFFRMEKDYFRRENDFDAVGGKSISSFGTHYNSGFSYMLEKLGLVARGQVIRYIGSTEIVDSLLSVQYMCSEGGVYPNYKLLETMHGKSVFENPYAFGLATWVDRDLQNINIDEYNNPFVLQNQIMKAIYGVSEDVFAPAEILNINEVNIVADEILDDGCIVYRKGQGEGYIEMIIAREENCSFYAYFPDSSGNISIQINGMNIDEFWSQTGKIINLNANTSDAETITLRVILNDTEMTLYPNSIYRLDMKNTGELLLSSEEADIKRFSTTHIEIEASTESEQLLLLSIPYDEEWHIKVNGDSVKAVPILNGLTGIVLQAGDYEIEMKYIPGGLRLGLLISVCFTIFLVCIKITDNRKRIDKWRRNHENN